MKWKPTEEEALRTGVGSIGVGKWKKILDKDRSADGAKAFHASRDSTSLKDKWVNLQKGDKKREADAKRQEKLAKKRKKEKKEKAEQQRKRDVAEAAKLRQRARELVQKKAKMYRAKEKEIKKEREDIAEKDTRSNAQALAFARAHFKKNQKEMLEANAQRAKKMGEKRAAADKKLAEIDAMSDEELLQKYRKRKHCQLRVRNKRQKVHQAEHQEQRAGADLCGRTLRKTRGRCWKQMP